MDQDALKKLNEIEKKFDKGYDYTKDHIRSEMFDDFEWLIIALKEQLEG